MKEEVSSLTERLKTQQRSLSYVLAYKLFQSAIFRVFINKCSASMLEVAMTNPFTKLMKDHIDFPKEVIKILKEGDYTYNLKICHDSPWFLFLDHVMNADKLISIEEILEW